MGPPGAQGPQGPPGLDATAAGSSWQLQTKDVGIAEFDFQTDGVLFGMQFCNFNSTLFAGGLSSTFIVNIPRGAFFFFQIPADVSATLDLREAEFEFMSTAVGWSDGVPGMGGTNPSAVLVMSLGDNRFMVGRL
jgi:hypothetical protein